MKMKRGPIILLEQIPIMRPYIMGEVHLIYSAICNKQGKAVTVNRPWRPIGL
jgi:hypothetical protein